MVFRSSAISAKFGHVSALKNFNNVIYAGNGDGILFISHDNGYTWDSIVTPMNNDSLSASEKFIWDIAVEKNFIYLASLGGVHKADTSSFNWLPINNGLIETQILSLYLFKGKLFAHESYSHSQRGGIYLFDEANQKWNCVLEHTNQFLWDPLTSHDSTLYCAAGPVIYSTTDFGIAWDEIPFKALFPDDDFITIEKMAFGKDILIGCAERGYIMRSEDFAKSWNVIEEGNLMASMPIIESLFNKEGIVLIGYYSGGLGVDTTIKISLDNGVTWKKANFELRSTARCFAMRDGRIFIGIEDGLIYSDDSLKTWHFVDDLVNIAIPNKNVFLNTLIHSTDAKEITVYNLQGRKLLTLTDKQIKIQNLKRYLAINLLVNGIFIISVKYSNNKRYFSRIHFERGTR